MTPNVFDAAAVLLVLAAFFGFINYHVMRLPFTIGLMLSGLVASGGVLVIDHVYPHLGLGDAVRTAVAPGAVSVRPDPRFRAALPAARILAGGCQDPDVGRASRRDSRGPRPFTAGVRGTAGRTNRNLRDRGLLDRGPGSDHEAADTTVVTAGKRGTSIRFRGLRRLTVTPLAGIGPAVGPRTRPLAVGDPVADHSLVAPTVREGVHALTLLPAIPPLS